VCFDNAFDDVFTDAVRRADVDFHVVVSNEAWFERSQESEQMLAFSRLAALSTGRTVVRATQSGTSIVIGPDGRDVARLVDSIGEDEMVRGYLLATVPVPMASRTPFEASGRASDVPERTPFVRLERLWFALFTVLPVLVLLSALRGGGKGGGKSGAKAGPKPGAKGSKSGAPGPRLPAEDEG
jgi:apolipoprotein N-acyltransferase